MSKIKGKTMTREQSNIIVNRIDLTTVIDTLIGTFVEAKVIYSYGYIETNKGILAVCSEGLGWTLYNEGDSCHISVSVRGACEKRRGEDA